MDWSKIKSIFIIAFLILDVYLLTQLTTKTQQFEVKTDTPFEDSLKTDGIKYDSLPKEMVSGQYMNANTKIFTDKELEKVKDNWVLLDDGAVIRTELIDPIAIGEEPDFTELDKYVKENVLYGDEYEFWRYDDELGTVTYYQKVGDKPLFMNQSAHLVFYIDGNDDVYFYDQTMLGKTEPINEEEEVPAAMRALEILYTKGLIEPNSTIKEAELGYYTLVSTEATQVLAPTWHFLVEHDGEYENLLVNAFEGQVIQAQTNEKILNNDVKIRDLEK